MKKLAQMGLGEEVQALLAARFPGIQDWDLSEPNGRGDLAIHFQGLRLDLRDIGEGLAEDFDPSDPEDVPLLRMGFHHQDPATGAFTELPDSSGCTFLDARAPWVMRLATAAVMFSRVYQDLGPAPLVEPGDDLGDWGQDLRHTCEALTHVGDDQFPEIKQAVDAAEGAGRLDGGLPASPPRVPTARM